MKRRTYCRYISFRQLQCEFSEIVDSLKITLYNNGWLFVPSLPEEPGSQQGERTTLDTLPIMERFHSNSGTYFRLFYKFADRTFEICLENPDKAKLDEGYDNFALWRWELS